jgi:predicted RNA-binding protein with RPS1 domain
MKTRVLSLALCPLACSAFLTGSNLNFKQANYVTVRNAQTTLSPVALSHMKEKMVPWVLKMANDDANNEVTETLEVVEDANEVLTEEETNQETENNKRNSKKSGIKLSEISNEQEFSGTVKGVTAFGAFIDIGAECDGLVHISQMSADFVKDAKEVVKVGDTVNVRILSVNADKKQIALTMKTDAEREADSERRNNKGNRGERRNNDEAKDVSEFAEFDPKAWVKGKVVSVQTYGAFVRLGEGIDGLLHISDTVPGSVETGAELDVRIIEVDKERGRISLTNQPLQRGKKAGFAQDYNVESNEEEEKQQGDNQRNSGFDFDPEITKLVITNLDEDDASNFFFSQDDEVEEVDTSDLITTLGLNNEVEDSINLPVGTGDLVEDLPEEVPTLSKEEVLHMIAKRAGDIKREDGPSLDYSVNMPPGRKGEVEVDDLSADPNAARVPIAFAKSISKADQAKLIEELEKLESENA